MADLGITYSLRFQARALAAQHADKINSKWFVGTNALREENEVRVLCWCTSQFDIKKSPHTTTLFRFGFCNTILIKNAF
jgi:hypothetical protein